MDDAVERLNDRTHRIQEWLDEMDEEVSLLAETHGWQVSRDFARRTFSRYLMCRRLGRLVTIRISDHKTYYKTEDLSLSPDGFDNDMNDVLRYLGNLP